MRWHRLALVVALVAPGCAHSGGPEKPRPGRWQVVYRPQDSHRKDNTLLVDTATGRTWFFDISQTRWWEIPRNNTGGELQETGIRLDLYDVKDITDALGETPAEDIDAPPCPSRLGGAAVVRLVREFVDPAGWEQEGRALEYRHPGTLVVKAPAGVHERIRILLGVLRERP